VSGGNDNDRIREIISWIIDNDTEESHDLGSMHTRLLDMGYSREEIDRAMLLIEADSARGGIFADEGFNRATRVLSAAEKSILSLEAQGWLLWMRGTGSISETHLSMIIESAGLECSTPASLDDVTEITQRYLPSIEGELEEDSGGKLN
jgi:uncharacterized protein Smg (DUF494 family)